MSLTPWIIGIVASGWIELSAGLPSDDDISTTAFGEGPDDLWIGTVGGMVWRSRDGGETFQLLFRPRSADPLVTPELANVRAPTVGDLGRGVGQDVPVRDRRGMLRRETDLAGAVRSRPRERGGPLLGSLVRNEVREPVAVNHITTCAPYVFVASEDGMWRTDLDGLHFELLFTGSYAGQHGVNWISCDATRPGRILINAESGILESLDWGDSFFRYSNITPFLAASFAWLDEQGRLVANVGPFVLREDAARTGYERLCMFTPDSLEASVGWSWERADGISFGVTDDGVLVCKDGVTTRLADERFARRVIEYVWLDDEDERHMLVATRDDVYESFDGGESFELIFTRFTSRSIDRVRVHPDRPEAVVVVSGGSIYRRLPPSPAAPNAEARIAEITRTTPLWEVVHTSLTRFELEPSQIAARRDDLRLRGLMPKIIGRVARLEGRFADVKADHVLFPVRDVPQIEGNGDDARTLWSVFFVWDLAGFVLDPLQADVVWADMERLRAEITYRVEDAYALWARSKLAAERPGLTPAQRAYHRLRVRETAAYLHRMTGDAFPQFADDTRL